MEKIVIAKRAAEVKFAPKVYLVLGILMLIAGIVLLCIPLDNFTFLEGYEAAIWIAKFVLLLGGIAVLVLAYFTWTRAKDMPLEIITYCGGVLTFSDGYSCGIKEVKSVRCSPDVYYGNDTVLDLATMGESATGSLTVVVDDKERIYRKIENVKQANDKLIELMLECREKGNENG